jgi:hypothetical protein
MARLNEERRGRDSEMWGDGTQDGIQGRGWMTAR